MNVDLEILVIRKYILSNRQERYVQFVSSEKNRKKLIKDLPHFKNFKWEMLDKITGDILDTINARLNSLNIKCKTCYAISENLEIDGKILETEIALNAIIGYGMASILIFGNAEIIYFEDENPNRRFISKN